MKNILIVLAVIGLVIYLSSDSSNKTYDYDYTDSYDTGLTLKGYECTEDCGGHEAGYDWAEEKGIDDPDDCGGNSNSFIEGCMSYAEGY